MDYESASLILTGTTSCDGCEKILDRGKKYLAKLDYEDIIGVYCNRHYAPRSNGVDLITH